MNYSPFLFSRPVWRKIALSTVVLASGVTQLVARPDPPAADRLMDPSKPENQGAGHLFFRSDDDTAPPPAPSPSEQAFKNFKKGPATFEEFCQLHPLTGKPLGQDRLVIEFLATEVDASAEATGANPVPSPLEPTATMLSEGRLIRQRMFGNTVAQTEKVLPLDRQSDGSKMPEPAWEGERLFTCLEQADTGYTLTFILAESRVVGWLQFPGSTIVQPILDQQEMNQKLPLSPDGKWTAFPGSLTRDVAADNGGAARKLRTVVYVRLVKN